MGSDFVLVSYDKLENLGVAVTVYFQKRSENKITFDFNMATTFETKEEAEEEKALRNLKGFFCIVAPENTRG